MTEHVRTPSYELAGFLRALADHLDRWDLASVNVSSDHGGGWCLQLFSGDASAGLTGWARSFGVAQLSVRPLAEQVNVQFSTTLGGYPVMVWGCVDALREAMGLTELDTMIDLAGLAHLAERGTVPQRRDPAGGGEQR